MAKILESDFRKELYKNLMDAGYDKVEAQKIVDKKYRGALKESLIEDIKAIEKNISDDKYNDIVIDADKINGTLDELKKLSELLK
jgi:hypothetical protein